MRIVWIIDNKFRELYGLYDLKKKLKESGINLYLVHKFSWKVGLEFFNPEIVIIPNLAKTSGAPILNYASKKNIDVYLHTSESIFYQEWVQKDKYPINLIKKIKKVLLWSKEDAKYLKKMGFSKKLFLSGALKFDKRRFQSITQNNSSKIKTVGIPTSLRYNTSHTYINVPWNIRNAVYKNDNLKLTFIKRENEYLELISRIIYKLSKKNIKVIIKPHPFESEKIYQEAFPEAEIFSDVDVRSFLEKTDIILNLRSSIAVDSIKFGIPVIKLDNCINWRKHDTQAPTSIGLSAKNFNDVVNLIIKNSPNKLFLKCKNKGDLKEAEKLACSNDNLTAYCTLFNKAKKEKKNLNMFYIFKYFFVEIRQFFFRGRRKQLFAFWNYKDRKLLKDLRLKINK